MVGPQGAAPALRTYLVLTGYRRNVTTYVGKAGIFDLVPIKAPAFRSAPPEAKFHSA
jgi:hypothetical protein